MKDFFSVMGKAFAVVFGSTSALALVLVLLVFAIRPVLRSWGRESPAANTQVSVRADEKQIVLNGTKKGDAPSTVLG
jgi:hypothetical protein